MFEVNGTYRNRIGEYTVLSIDGRKMTVRYSDGTEAEVNVAIQERIWENILAEQEARAGSSRNRAGGKDTNHYIKAISIPLGEELVFPGWQERVVMVPGEETAQRLKAGDRLIYYAMEAHAYFAVVTTTGEMFEAKPKQYTYTIEDETANFYNIDIDAASIDLERAISVETIELESYPDFRRVAQTPEAFYRISEDDFELLAEALTEVTEDEDDDNDDFEEFDEEDED